MNLSKDISVISKLGNILKLLGFLETTLTVGIIGYTVFRIVNIFRTQD